MAFTTNNSVLYNVDQDFPESAGNGASKERARNNIGAASAAALTAETQRATDAEKAAKSEVVAGPGVTVSTTTAQDGHSIYTVGNTGSGLYKTLQDEIDQQYADYGFIRRLHQTRNGNVAIECSYISAATQSDMGLMSTFDKTKLDGIQVGAEVNQNAFSNIRVGSSTLIADSKTDTLSLIAGTGITLTPDVVNDSVTITASGSQQVQSDWTEDDPTSAAYIQNKPNLSTYATQTDLANKQDVLTAGTNITISDNVISATAAPQEQANWEESDTTSVQYIQNKPTIPPALSAGSGIAIANDAISRRVQFVSTSSTYAAVRNIINNGDLPVLDVVNGSMHNLYVCTLYRGTDIQFVGSAYGQTTLYNLASNSTWTSQILEPQILTGNAGQILAVNAAGTDAEWKTFVEVPSYSLSNRNQVLKVIHDSTGVHLGWDQPSGYASWVTDWASGYTQSHTVTADDVAAGYFDLYQAFASDADTTSATIDPIRVNLVWDTLCTAGPAGSFVSSIDFAIGVADGSYRSMFTDSSPANEVHKDWYLYPNYILHTRCNRIRIRYHLTERAVEGTLFQNSVSGLVDQVR